jgi:hypothetical protein
MAGQLMRTRGRNALCVRREEAAAAGDECAMTPKQRMEARKLADANVRMQQINLHVQTNCASHAHVQARKHKMMAGSISPAAHPSSPYSPSSCHPKAESAFRSDRPWTSTDSAERRDRVVGGGKPLQQISAPLSLAYPCCCVAFHIMSTLPGYEAAMQLSNTLQLHDLFVLCQETECASGQGVMHHAAPDRFLST